MHTTSRTRACAHAQDHMHTMPIKSTCTPAHTHTSEKGGGWGVKTNLKARVVVKSKRDTQRG